MKSRKSMKILLIHNFYQKSGGEEHAFHAEKKRLVENGHKVILYMKNNKNIKHFSLGGKIKLFLTTVFSFTTFSEIKKIAKEEKPDVAHIHNIFPLISPSVYYALKKLNIPVVQTVHNLRYICPSAFFYLRNGNLCERCKNGNFIHSVVRKCYRNSYLQTSSLALSLFLHHLIKTFVKKIDIFISPSSFLKKKLIEGKFPAEKIRVLPHFIDSNASKEEINPEKYAVYIGRLSREKGVLSLISAWEHIKYIPLKVLGNGPLISSLKQETKKRGIKNMEFLGYVQEKEKNAILKKAMFLVFPTECCESFGYSIIESYANGIPVIGSNVGAVSELIIDKETGLLFERKNINDLIEKIKTVNQKPDLLRRMRKRAISIFIEKYSNEEACTKITNVFEEAIGINYQSSRNTILH